MPEIYLIEYDRRTYRYGAWETVRDFFKKDKMSVNTAVAYLSWDAAQRALTQAGQYLTNVRIVKCTAVGQWEYIQGEWRLVDETR